MSTPAESITASIPDPVGTESTVQTPSPLAPSTISSRLKVSPGQIGEESPTLASQVQELTLKTSVSLSSQIAK